MAITCLEKTVDIGTVVETLRRDGAVAVADLAGLDL